MSLGGDVDGIDDKVGELEVGKGGHVDARAAAVGLGNLVQLRLQRLVQVVQVVMARFSVQVDYQPEVQPGSREWHQPSRRRQPSSWQHIPGSCSQRGTAREKGW